MARANKKKIQRRNRFEIAVAITLLLVAAGWFLHRSTIAVLQPAGPIAAGEKRLLVAAFLLMLLVVVPVFALTFGFVLRYREHNKATYTPNWDHSRIAETVWWLIPGSLIIVLSFLAWHGSYDYDPYKPIASKTTPLTVQVVALDWRWLFIYPDQHVASINQLYMPVNRPIRFEITADAPMNSFWIPRLGGQIYAMPGMNTELNLMASKPGSYIGRSANISGHGFAGMQFTAVAGNADGFTAWIHQAKLQPTLTQTRYAQLAQASTSRTVHYYGTPDNGLYESIINKYMAMGDTTKAASTMDAQMDMNMGSMQ